MWRLSLDKSVRRATCVVLLVQLLAATTSLAVDPELRLSLTISARLRNVEISWTGLPIYHTGVVFITAVAVPLNSTFHLQTAANTVQPALNNRNDDEKFYASTENVQPAPTQPTPSTPTYRTSAGIAVQFALPLNGTAASAGWHTTDVPHNPTAAPLTVATECYGFWATYVPDPPSSVGRQQTCLRAHPRWMHTMRAHIESVRMRDLYLVGTHDSGSYRVGFDPRANETRVSKYTLTQDDDVYTQLLLGVRYLDIRVGSYRTKSGGDASRHSTAGDLNSNAGRQFWVNHGISRVQPLDDVLRQVRDFVLATDEIVVFDVQEFPVGFDKPARHRALVYHVQQQLRDVLVSAHLTWDATLAQIWRTGGRVIVSYDHAAVVQEFGDVVFQSVQQRWGDVQTIGDLRRHLSPAGRGFSLLTARPVADMAEMTPTPWDVLTDKYGGLRRMADDTNREISAWYEQEWSDGANIVAADFVRGTTLMETALRRNRRRFVLN